MIVSYLLVTSHTKYSYMTVLSDSVIQNTYTLLWFLPPGLTLCTFVLLCNTYLICWHVQSELTEWCFYLYQSGNAKKQHQIQPTQM